MKKAGQSARQLVLQVVSREYGGNIIPIYIMFPYIFPTKNQQVFNPQTAGVPGSGRVAGPVMESRAAKKKKFDEQAPVLQ